MQQDLSHTIFRTVPPTVQQALWAQAQLRTYTEGHVLVQQGEKPEHVYLVLSGCVRVWWVAERAPARTINVARAGQLVGEIGLLANRPRTATVIALKDAQALVWTNDTFRSLLAKHSDLSFALMAALCDRVLCCNHAFEVACSYSTTARVAHLLAELYDDFAELTDGHPCIGIRLSHTEIAGMLGMARENVTKAISALRRDGCLGRYNGQIEVMNRERLISWTD